MVSFARDKKMMAVDGVCSTSVGKGPLLGQPCQTDARWSSSDTGRIQIGGATWVLMLTILSAVTVCSNTDRQGHEEMWGS